MKKCPKCNANHDKPGRYCSRPCANSRTWSDSHKKKLSHLAKANPVGFAKARPCNSGRKKDITKWTSAVCPTCKESFDTYIINPKVFCSKECVKLGGLRKNSGIGKSGWYDGVFLNSTYELAYWIYCKDHNIEIARCNKSFKYIDPDSGKTRTYYPDFEVEKEIIEIKGYKRKIDQIKASSCNAKILYESDLKDVFKYIENKTGKKVSNLYELYDPIV